MLLYRPLPILVLSAIEGDAVALAVDVPHVVATPGSRVPFILVASQPPVGIAGHRIDRDSPDELHFVPAGADDVRGNEALFEDLQFLWIAALSLQLDWYRRPVGVVAQLFVAINRLPDLALR